MVGVMIPPFSERLRYMELPHPWLYASTGFISPTPVVLKNSVDAIIKPFIPGLHFY